MTSQFDIASLAEVINVCSNETVTAGGAELDIPDGSLIDSSKYHQLWVLATAAAVGTGGGVVQVYENDTNAAAGQTAVAGAVLNFDSADDNDHRYMNVRCHGRKRYLNIGVTAAAGTGNVSITIVAIGVRLRRQSEIATSEDTAIAELTIA